MFNSVRRSSSSALNLSDVVEKYTETSNPVVCQNITVIRNTVNCNIKGGNQMCAAEGALEILRDPVISKSVKTTAKEESSEQIHSSMIRIEDIIGKTNLQLSGLNEIAKEHMRRGRDYMGRTGVRNVVNSVSSSIMHDAVTRMNTKCNQAVHALNKAIIDGTICSKDEYMTHISNFGEQESGVSSLAQCAFGEGGWKDVVGGVDQRGPQFVNAMAELARDWVPKGVEPLLSIYYACFVASLILTVGWSASSHKSRFSPFLRLLTIIAVIASMCVWPGRMAVRYGYAPFSDPVSRATVGGKWVCDTEAMEKFFITPLGRPHLDKQSGELQHGGYTGCGIYSGKCAEPGVPGDLARWTKINNACLRFPTSSIESCSAQSLFDGVLSSTNVPHCKRCKGMHGLYDGMVDCEQVNEIPLDKYGGFGSSFLSNGTVKTITCPEDDSACISDKTVYNRISPGECIAGEYHEQKREVVNLYKRCMDIKNEAKNPVDAVGEMCPPKPNDYLKCSDKGRCYYENVFASKECSNDLEGCANIAYLQDKFYLDAIGLRCDLDKALNHEKGRLISVAVSIVYLLIVPLLVSVFVWRWFKNGRVQPVPWPIFVTSMLLIVPMIVVLVPPYGVFQVGSKSGIYKEGWLPFNGDGKFDFLGTLIPMVICLFLVTVSVPLVYLRGKLLAGA